MLACKIEAKYAAADDRFELNRIYPVIAIARSDDIETAAKAIEEVMGDNGWNEINILKYGPIKAKAQSEDDNLGIKALEEENRDWRKSIEEDGAFYIVYGNVGT